MVNESLEQTENVARFQVGSTEGQLKNTRGSLTDTDTTAVSETFKNGDASGTIGGNRLTLAINTALAQGRDRVVIDMSREEGQISDDDITAIKKRRDNLQNNKGVDITLENVTVAQQRQLRTSGVEGNGLTILNQDQTLGARQQQKAAQNDASQAEVFGGMAA